MLEAFELAHGEIMRICDAIDELAREVGKPKWVDLELNAELAAASRRRDRPPDRRARASRTPVEIVDELARRGGARDHDGLRPRTTSSASSRCGTGLKMLLEAKRLEVVESAGPRAVRERPARAHRRRAGLEGAEVAASATSSTAGSSRRSQLPFPSPRASSTRRTRSRGRTSRRPPTRSTRTSSARRSRSTSAGPTVAARRRSGRSRPRSDVSPRTHGSALFTRGQTQILTLCTLGTAKEQQRIDDLSTEKERRYIHHYNFPPYSVGETGFMRGPEAPRHRPRRARAAGARGGHPAARGLPVHDPPRLRDARVERLVVDGLGLRLDDVADARRRADRGARLGHRDGPRQGGRRLRRS